MTTISPKEYLEMQVRIATSLLVRMGSSAVKDAKMYTDDILKLNDTQVSESPKIEAMTRREFQELMHSHRLCGFNDFTDEGWKILEQRGMVKV